jgi:hypothetical protein
MTTHDVHEVLLNDIRDRCYSFVSLIPRTPTASIVFPTNSRIGGGPNGSCFIPDFQAVLTKYVERRRAKDTIKWIGECGFSQGDKEIIKKYKDMTAMSTSIDLAIMISIDKKPWCSPTRDSTIDKAIRAHPEMSIDDFVHDTLDSPDITYGPVTVVG